MADDGFEELIDATSRAGQAQHALNHQVIMDHFAHWDRAIEQYAALSMVMSGADLAREVARNPTSKTL